MAMFVDSDPPSYHTTAPVTETTLQPSSPPQYFYHSPHSTMIARPPYTLAEAQYTMSAALPPKERDHGQPFTVWTSPFETHPPSPYHVGQGIQPTMMLETQLDPMLFPPETGVEYQMPINVPQPPYIQDGWDVISASELSSSPFTTSDMSRQSSTVGDHPNEVNKVRAHRHRVLSIHEEYAPHLSVSLPSTLGGSATRLQFLCNRGQASIRAAAEDGESSADFQLPYSAPYSVAGPSFPVEAMATTRNIPNAAFNASIPTERDTQYDDITANANEQATNNRTESCTKAKKVGIPRGRTAPRRKRTHRKSCDHCGETFKGDHEVRRHWRLKHAKRKTVYWCVDKTGEHKHMLEHCKSCRNGKEYNAEHNLAAHIRRTHYNPTGRRRKGEKIEKRGGIGGGNFPPLQLLRNNFIQAKTVIYEGGEADDDDEVSAQGDSSPVQVLDNSPLGSPADICNPLFGKTCNLPFREFNEQEVFPASNSIDFLPEENQSILAPASSSGVTNAFENINTNHHMLEVQDISNPLANSLSHNHETDETFFLFDIEDLDDFLVEQ